MAELNLKEPHTDTSYPLEQFFDLSPDLLCIAGFDGYFKKVNKAVSTLLGYTTEELYSRPIDDFVYHDDKTITSNARNALRKSAPLLNFENRYQTKAGDIVWLSWTSMPDEKRQLVFAIAKNITYKKGLEEQRNRRLTNLTAHNNDLKQLTYTTSHDLRSPINNMLLLFDMLDLSKITDPDTVGLLNILKSSAKTLHNTVNNYVDALGDRKELHTQVEELRFNDCLQVVLQSINASLDDSLVKLHTDFSAAETILFNKAYLESIFLNLLTNSIKYARPGVAPEISITSTIVNGAKHLVISDNGRGFDMMEVKDKIFGLNQKFHNHQDSKGIGLYLVQNYITSLGGKILVESEVNKGTTFIIIFKKEE